MTICQTCKEQRSQSRNQLDSAAKGTPSAYNHNSEDMGVVMRTDVNDDGFSTISVASPCTAPPFSDVVPPSVRDPGLPRPFGLYRGVAVVEHVNYWTENHGNRDLDLQAAIYDCDIGVLQKAKHSRSLQHREPTGSYENVQEKKSGATREPTAGFYDDNEDGDDDNDDSLLHAKDSESYGNTLLNLTVAEHGQWEGLQDAHNSPVVTTYGTVCVKRTISQQALPSPWTAQRASSHGCSENPGRPQPLPHQPVRSCVA